MTSEGVRPSDTSVLNNNAINLFTIHSVYFYAELPASGGLRMNRPIHSCVIIYVGNRLAEVCSCWNSTVEVELKGGLTSRKR